MIFKNFFYQTLKQSSGAILFIILTVFMILIPLVQGVWMDSQSYYQLRRTVVNRMKARANAQSGLDLSLLRLYIFKGAEKSIPQKIKSQFVSVLDQSWLFPFQWPLLDTGDLLESEKDLLEEINKQSFLEGGYSNSIKPEDGLLDLNNLSSPFESFREFTYLSLLQLLLLQVEEHDELKDKYDESSLEEIVNNIADGMDLDREKQNGGLEDKLALNRSFISLEELKKIPGLEEDLYQLLKPYVTVYGSSSLNINYSKDKILEALGLPPDLVEQVLFRIDPQSELYQPFGSKEDFCNFSIEQGYDFCKDLIDVYGHLDLLSFDSPIAFRIKSRGWYRSQTVELEAMFYDLVSSAVNYQKRVYLEEQRLKNPNFEEKKTESQDDKLKIDYSFYKSLVILYLKENHLDL